MDWENERYVRVYVRDTVELKLLSWTARALLWEVLRKADRQGRVDLGRHDVKGLAVLVNMPVEVVSAALPELIEDGCVTRVENHLVIPNWKAAQESKQSDAQRARESRARNREASPSVTERDAAITERDAGVTARPAASQPVTAGHSVPSVPSVPSQEGERAGARETPPPSSTVQYGSRALRDDEPFTDTRRTYFDTVHGQKPIEDPAPDVWRNFVNYFGGEKRTLFVDDRAIDARWRRWVDDEAKRSAERRIQRQESRPRVPETKPEPDATPLIRRSQRWEREAAPPAVALESLGGLLRDLGAGPVSPARTAPPDDPEIREAMG